jgi:hypothetical protein
MPVFEQMRAVVCEGKRLASGTSTQDPMFNDDGGTIRLQAQKFKERGLDLESYFPNGFVFGTLYLSVAPQRFRVGKTKHFFSDVQWTEKLIVAGEPYRENFFLDEAEVVFGGKVYKAMLYIPDPATKLGPAPEMDRVEAIAEDIPGITYGDAVTLRYALSALIFDKNTSAATVTNNALLKPTC